MPIGRQHCPISYGRSRRCRRTKSTPLVTKAASGSGSLILLENSFVQSVHIAETRGPTKPLRLALGGLGSGLHICQQEAPNHTACSLLLDSSSSMGPHALGNKTWAPGVASAASLFPASLGQRWLEGENQASGAASCLPAGPQEDDSCSACQLSFSHSAPLLLTADKDFHFRLWFSLLTPSHNNSQAQFPLDVNSSVLNDEDNFAGLF